MKLNLSFILKRRQFHIILAFVITINISQGHTFKKVGVFLLEPVFAHRQLYVAVSKSRDENELKIFIANTGSQGKLLQNNRTLTKNVVLKELLR